MIPYHIPTTCTTLENVPRTCATGKNSDQPTHLYSLITLHSVDSQGSKVSLHAQLVPGQKSISRGIVKDRTACNKFAALLPHRLLSDIHMLESHLCKRPL